MKRIIIGVLFAFAATLPPLQAEELTPELATLRADWDYANFSLQGDEKSDRLSELAERARAIREASPGEAEPLVWEAIVLSSLAGAKGGLGALDLVKQARERLLEAERIDPEVLNGSVYTSLGSLYYQVPGWPLGFGDDKKAREYLEKALALDPDGIDPHYFYGDFLLDQGDYKGAVAVLERALELPPRPGRELADAGRRKEIRAAIEKARQKMVSAFTW